MRVGIIGAGIIGLALARELLKRGAEVFLVDPREPATEATFASAGLLSPSGEAPGPGDFFDLCRAAAAGYPDFIGELEDATGLPAGYRTGGTIYLYHSAEEREQLEARFGWQREAGILAVHMDEQEVRTLEPEARAPGGYLLPGDCHVNSRVLASVLIQACRMRGANSQKAKATAVAEQDGRAVGIRLSDGVELAADAIVNAAGAWASQITAPAEPKIEVRPVKGHMLALATGRWDPQYALRNETVYLLPRPGPRVIIGSTMEEAGFDKAVDPLLVGRLRSAAERIVPRLTNCEMVESWTGLRPATPDGRPLIGPTSLRGYYVAVGHLRNGILLAPITAQLLAPVILGDEPNALLKPFTPVIG